MCCCVFDGVSILILLDTGWKIYVSVQGNNVLTGPYDVFITITGPNGAIHTAGVTPEISALADDALGEYSVNIPTDSDDYYLAGEYTVTILIKKGATEIETNTNSYTYAPLVHPGTSTDVTGVLDFTATINCLTGQIEMVDDTDYTGFALTDDPGRVVTVTPPTATSESETIQSLDYTAAIENVAFGFTNAIYTATIEVYLQQINLTGEIDFAVNILLSHTIPLTISCDSGLCDMAGCIGEELTRLEALACNGIGWSGLTAKQKGRLEYMLVLANMVALYRNCRDYDNAAAYQLKLKNFIGTGCNCGASTSTDPVPYVAPTA